MNKSSTFNKINLNSNSNEYDYLRSDFNYNNNDFPEYLFQLISNEEKIFDDYDDKVDNNKGTNLYKRIQKKKKEKAILMNPIQKLLSKIYKSDYKFLINVRNAKKKKNLNLEEYQSNLVKTISQSLGKESLRKLQDEMKDLKFMSKCVYNFKSKKFIKQMEEKEYDIIRNMQKNEAQLEKLRKVGKINQIQPIPNIKFKRISKDWIILICSL